MIHGKCFVRYKNVIYLFNILGNRLSLKCRFDGCGHQFGGYDGLGGLGGFNGLSGFGRFDGLDGFDGFSGLDGIGGFDGFSGFGGFVF